MGCHAIHPNFRLNHTDGAVHRVVLRVISTTEPRMRPIEQIWKIKKDPSSFSATTRMRVAARTRRGRPYRVGVIIDSNLPGDGGHYGARGLDAWWFEWS